MELCQHNLKKDRKTVFGESSYYVINQELVLLKDSFMLEDYYQVNCFQLTYLSELFNGDYKVHKKTSEKDISILQEEVLKDNKDYFLFSKDIFIDLKDKYLGLYLAKKTELINVLKIPEVEILDLNQ